MPDELDKIFFDEIFQKVNEMEEIGRKYKCGVVALVVPITPAGNSKFRLLRPGLSKTDLYNVLSRSYDWAVEQIENDPRLKP